MSVKVFYTGTQIWMNLEALLSILGESEHVERFKSSHWSIFVQIWSVMQVN